MALMGWLAAWAVVYCLDKEAAQVREGLKDARTTLLVGLACYWGIGAPAAWLLTFTCGWGAQGVWWGLAIGLATAAIGLTLCFEVKTAWLLKPRRAALST